MAAGDLTRRAALVAAGALTLLATAPRPAGAQAVVPGQQEVLDGLSPNVAGLTVQVLTTVGEEIVVANPTPTPVYVLAGSPTHEPFLQIGPDGVQANFASPAWYRSNDPSGVAPLPPGLDPAGPPRWVKVAAAPSWGWFDPRLNAATWTLDLRYGSQPVTARGHVVLKRASGALVARLASPTTPVPGVVVALAQGSVPALFLQVSGAQTVVVLGEHGEPFLRVRSGAVEVNEASPSWALTAASRGDTPTGVVDPSAAPRWRQLDNSGRISWLEGRARYAPGEPPADVQARRSATDLLSWSVPLLINGAAYRVAGVTSWVPNLSPGSVGLQQATAGLSAPAAAHHGSSGWLEGGLIALGAVIIAGAGAVAFKRARFRRARAA